jgi:hypothetical protein
MDTDENLFNPELLQIDRNLLLKFFVVFSKFELALKNSTFVVGNDRRADPNWDCFGRSLRHAFRTNWNPALAEACDCLLLNPPMKQVVLDKRLAWSTVGPDQRLSDIEQLLLLIRHVRNNLFHGGKFNTEVFEDTERQGRLLESSLVVLAECLRLSPQVKSMFDAATI